MFTLYILGNPGSAPSPASQSADEQAYLEKLQLLGLTYMFTLYILGSPGSAPSPASKSADEQAYLEKLQLLGLTYMFTLYILGNPGSALSPIFALPLICIMVRTSMKNSRVSRAKTSVVSASLNYVNFFACCC